MTGDAAREVIERLFHAALDLPEKERAAFLQQQCHSDPALRSQVECLLESDAAAAKIFEAPGASSDQVLFHQLLGDDSDSTVSSTLARLSAQTPKEPRYELGKEIARGGMGAILEAFDKNLQRRVALKVILDHEATSAEQATPATSPRILERFLEEAQITGQLDHPGIVPVYEVGVDASGRAFFAMRLVKGQDLGTILKRRLKGDTEWSHARVVDIILRACEAMSYAHNKRVIHRDLKPSNIMVGRFGEVYVMDWGLARLLYAEDKRDVRVRASLEDTVKLNSGREDPDSPLLTMDGDVVGTPAYMSPEQARGEIESMGPRSDVYSIGAILYHLLAGHMPYVAPDSRLSSLAVWGLVQAGPPQSLEAEAKNAPQALASIADKAMARDPSDRYADTLELAQDLRAFVEGRVVMAHRTGAFIELSTWIRRNRAITALASLVIVSLITGLSGTLWQYAEATTSQEKLSKSLDAERKAREFADGHRLAALATMRAEREPTLALQLARIGAELAPATLETNTALLDALEHYQERATLYGHEGPVKNVVVSPDGRWITSVDSSALQIVWDAKTFSLKHRFDDHASYETDDVPKAWNLQWTDSPVRAIGFSPDSATVFSAGLDGTARLFSSSSGHSLQVLKHPCEILCAAFSDDGAQFYTGGVDGELRAWDPESGKLIGTVHKHAGPVKRICVRHGLMASIGTDQKVWWHRAGSAPREIQLSTAPSRPAPWKNRPNHWSEDVEFDARGTRFVTRSRDGTASLWDGTNGSKLQDFTPPDDIRNAVNGEVRISASGTKVYLLWLGPDVRRAEVRDLRSKKSHELDTSNTTVWPYHPKFSPDEETIVRVAIDKVNVIDLRLGTLWRELRAHQGNASSVQFLGEDQIVTAGDDRTVRIWNLFTLPERRGARGAFLRVGTQGDQGVVLASDRSQRYRAQKLKRPIQVMDTKTGAIRSELEAKQQFSNAIPDRLGHLALLKDYLVASHQIIDVRSGTIVHEFPSLRITHAAFSYDSKLLAIIVRGQPAPKVGKLIIHDIETGKTRTTEVHHDLTRVEFSPDGKYVSLCEGHGYTASLWQVEPLREVHRFPPQGNSFCTAASFSPDQRSILICCVGRNPVLYDLDRKTMIRTFSRLPRTTASVRWSHDGHWVAVYSGGSSVHIYAADTGEMHLQRVFHDSTWVGGVHAPIGFTPDDRFLMTYEAPGVVRYMPIDPLEFTRSLKVRPISAEDMQRFHIGTPEEWATRREEDLEAIGTTRALSKRALLALDHDRLDEAFGWVRRARKLRKRAAPRVLHFVRACVLSRRADRSPESAVQDRRDAIDELKAIKGKFDFGWLESRHLNGLRAEPGFRELMVTSTSELRKRK